LERDGLLQRAREIELRALVRWLGGRGVSVVSDRSGDTPAVHVSWRRTPIRAWVASAVACGATTGGLTSSALVAADPVAEKHMANFCEYFDFIRREWMPNTGTNKREDAARENLKKLFGD